MAKSKRVRRISQRAGNGAVVATVARGEHQRICLNERREAMSAFSLLSIGYNAACIIHGEQAAYQCRRKQKRNSDCFSCLGRRVVVFYGATSALRHK